MKVTLNNENWSLKGFLPHVPINDAHYFKVFQKTPEIKATVPGGVHLDLYNAGLIDNPYIDDNSIRCEWIENRWWLYETNVKVDYSLGKKVYLVFDGLDYSVDIYVNNTLCHHHENMYTKARIDITDFKTETINIKLLFKGAPEENGQYGRTSETHTQKSRFGYNWDFATRLINIGIWGDVWLYYINDIELTESKILTDYKDGKGYVDASFIFDGVTTKDVNITLLDPSGKIIEDVKLPYSSYINKVFEVNNPSLWYPNGMGEHPLYKLTIKCDDVESRYNVGIRSIRYEQNEGAPKNTIPYTIVINGEKVRIKGMNKVPMDHLYGNADFATYEWCVKAVANQNGNMIRVWGGGVIEKEVFYDLCDKYGILIWQDFIQSSSVDDHVPSKDVEFLKKLRDSARENVKVKRNHVSLALWCGGNELTDENNIPATYEDENVALLNDIVRANDPQRLFLPTTPSGPVYGTDVDNPNNHDTHGPWDYLGPRDEYVKFNNLKILLNSEVGLCSVSEDTDLFMTSNNMDYENDYKTYRHHGGYWFHSYEKDKEIFGTFGTSKEAAIYDQWLQGEALRYIVEAEERKLPRCSGSQIWCINEPWPAADNSALVEYFGHPKLAYYWVKQAFSECGASLKYDSLIVDKVFNAEIHLTKKAKDVKATYYTLDGKKLDEVKVNTNEKVVTLTRDMTDIKGMFFVRLISNGVCKDYFFSLNEDMPYRCAKDLEKVSLSYELTETSCDNDFIYYKATVKNTGGVTALFVHPFDETKGYAIMCDDSHFSLLPGEAKEVNLTVRKRLGLFFDKVTWDSNITFKCLNKK